MRRRRRLSYVTPFAQGLSDILTLSKTLPNFMVLQYWTDILLLNARLSELLMNGCYSPRTLKQGPNSTESPEKVCKSC